MTDFQCSELADSTVMIMFLEKDKIFLDPPYQRSGEIWNLYKKQLLIDSLINGFDIPKLYLHEYEKAQRMDGRLYKYAIVDGKQRFTAMWEFMSGGFNLSDEIQFLAEPTIRLAGLSYDDLSREHPRIHARFTGRRLSVISIRTSDTDLIEDMFSRLNEAVPLNAAERRNAFGGPLTPIIRDLAGHEFFADRLAISSSRYRHYDLACKFLYLQDQGKPVETKKFTLDGFVVDFAKRQLKARAQTLRQETTAVLDTMRAVFKAKDPLLKSPGIAAVYYLLFSDANRCGKQPEAIGLTRDRFQAFQGEIESNRRLAENDLAKAQFELLEFDRLSQTPNDASSIEYRLKILRGFLTPFQGRTLHDQSRSVALSSAMLSKTYRFTHAELRLVEQMLLGRTPAEAANELGVTIHSVRVYLKRLYNKVGVRSQTALMKRLVQGTCDDTQNAESLA